MKRKSKVPLEERLCAIEHGLQCLELQLCEHCGLWVRVFEMDDSGNPMCSNCQGVLEWE